MGLKDFFTKRKKQKLRSKLKKAPIAYNGQLLDLKQAAPVDDKVSELWTKCPDCEELLYKSNLLKNLNVCKHCNYHFRLTAKERIELLTDEGSFKEIDKNVKPADPLNFEDLKPYKDRLKAASKTNEAGEAIVTGIGEMEGKKVAIASMEFKYIGGSMGSVVGEKITRLVEKAIKNRLPVIIVSSSGGARMHEGILSLMQMAKTSSALEKLHEEKLLYISLLTEPTFGGVTASFAMLGDIIVAEPKARIGFAGRRVIEETIKQKLPKEFQTAEYLLENGQIDMVIERSKLKDSLSDIIKLHSNDTKSKRSSNSKSTKSTKNEKSKSTKSVKKEVLMV